MNSGRSDRLWSRHLDKILFGIGLSYFFSVILWLFLFKPQPIAQKPAVSSQEAQFIAYLQQSLNVLDRKLNYQGSQSEVPPPPTVNFPSNTSSAPTVVERIYVPVYPPNQTQPPLSAIQPPPSSTVTRRVPPPPPVSTPSTVPVLTPPTTLVPPPVETATASPPAAHLNHTLVGLLESGDRSYALFTLNGVTRRFEPGEALGGTSWILIGIANQQAVISNNGQTRYLGVGQSF